MRHIGDRMASRRNRALAMSNRLTGVLRPKSDDDFAGRDTGRNRNGDGGRRWIVGYVGSRMVLPRNVRRRDGLPVALAGADGASSVRGTPIHPWRLGPGLIPTVMREDFRRSSWDRPIAPRIEASGSHAAWSRVFVAGLHRGFWSRKPPSSCPAPGLRSSRELPPSPSLSCFRVGACLSGACGFAFTPK